MTLRIIFILASVAIQAQVTPPAPSKGRIEGRVVSAAGGEGLKKSTVRLRRTGGAPGTSTAGPQNSTIVATTDAEGKFVFDEVDAGQYVLSAERSGYVNQNYNARSGRTLSPMTLTTGQQIKDIIIKMVSQGVISGKVVDEDGDPMPGTQIQVFRYGYTRGPRQLMGVGGAGANPDGTFMIGNLAAGRYYVAAINNRSFQVNNGERTVQRGPEEGYVATYFPNATEISAAVPLDLAAGQELRAIDIRMRKQRVYTIRGKVATDQPVQNLTLMLIAKGNGAALSNRGGASIRDKEGSFEFRRVPSGQYVIQGNPNMRMNGQQEGAHLSTRYEITVGEQDIENLVLPLFPLLQVNGAMKIEGSDWAAGTQNADQKRAANTGSGAPGTPGAQPRNRPNINLISTEGGISFGQSGSQVGDDGTFSLKNIMPGKYRLNVFGIPDGTYIKSIRFGNQDITRTELDLTSGSGGALEILFSPKAGEVSGVVRDRDGNAVAGVTVSMWLPGTMHEQAKSSVTDQTGAFKLRNLSPGDYKLIAWEDVEPVLVFNTDFCSQFNSQATTISVKEGSTESVEAKLLPKDVIDAEIAKMK